MFAKVPVRFATYVRKPRSVLAGGEHYLIYPTCERAAPSLARLCLKPRFGTDPWANNMELGAIRNENFNPRYPQFDHFFHSLANGNQGPFREGLLYIISVTQRLSMSMQ